MVSPHQELGHLRLDSTDFRAEIMEIWEAIEEKNTIQVTKEMHVLLELDQVLGEEETLVEMTVMEDLGEV